MSNVKPGRELDALVAEKVFGRKTNGDFFYDEGFNDGEIPLYSTMIEDAWAVVEYLENNGYEHDIRYFDNGYTVTLYRTGREWTGPFADTAPLAICLAALKAVGAEV